MLWPLPSHRLMGGLRTQAQSGISDRSQAAGVEAEIFSDLRRVEPYRAGRPQRDH